MSFMSHSKLFPGNAGLTLVIIIKLNERRSYSLKSCKSNRMTVASLCRSVSLFMQIAWCQDINVSLFQVKMLMYSWGYIFFIYISSAFLLKIRPNDQKVTPLVYMDVLYLYVMYI